MKRMEKNELLNCQGGGLLTVVANIVVSLISLTKAILSLKTLGR